MNLGFADQFVPMVEDGSKTHTIRAGERWKVGMRADLYRESRRQKVYDEYGRQVSGMSLIFRAPVVRVQAVEIVCDPSKRTDGYPSARTSPLYLQAAIYIDGSPLDEDERNAFAWRDGFRHRTLVKPTDVVSVVSRETVGCFRMMVDFWAEKHGFGRRIREFRGQIVHWDYERRRIAKETWPKGRQHPCEYIDPVTHYDPPFGGAR